MCGRTIVQHQMQSRSWNTSTSSYPFWRHCPFKFYWRKTFSGQHSCLWLQISTALCTHATMVKNLPGLDWLTNHHCSHAIPSTLSAWSPRPRPRKHGDFSWISACLAGQASLRDCSNLWDYGMQLPALISLSDSAVSQATPGPVSAETGCDHIAKLKSYASVLYLIW